MDRTLIVAKIVPGSEDEVAKIFAASDRTGLPQVVGVTHRSLYSLGDVYVHLVETQDPGPESITRGQGHPEFRRISEQLRRFISPYSPTWRSPADAVAAPFYTWQH